VARFVLVGTSRAILPAPPISPEPSLVAASRSDRVSFGDGARLCEPSADDVRLTANAFMPHAAHNAMNDKGQTARFTM
jgi:hypothetical protein